MYYTREEQAQAKKEAATWITEGKPCGYRYGWAYRGKGARPITSEKAKELLKGYNIGMSFHRFNFEDGMLVFNEYGENDLM